MKFTTRTGSYGDQCAINRTRLRDVRGAIHERGVALRPHDRPQRAQPFLAVRDAVQRQREELDDVRGRELDQRALDRVLELAREPGAGFRDQDGRRDVEELASLADARRRRRQRDVRQLAVRERRGERDVATRRLRLHRREAARRVLDHALVLARLLHERERAGELRRRHGREAPRFQVALVLRPQRAVAEDLRGGVDEVRARGEARVAEAVHELARHRGGVRSLDRRRDRARGGEVQEGEEGYRYVHGGLVVELAVIAELVVRRGLGRRVLRDGRRAVFGGRGARDRARCRGRRRSFEPSFLNRRRRATTRGGVLRERARTRDRAGLERRDACGHGRGRHRRSRG
eukprot:29980-Pelagococcus_subviridis.AAC.3